MLFQGVFSQQTFSLQGKLIDDKDSLALFSSEIYLEQGDSLYKFSLTDNLGEFQFENLNAGKYFLQMNYFYFPSKRVEINLSKDTLISFSLEEGDLSLQLKEYKIKPFYTILYFGLPVYTDYELNKIGELYSVKWVNLGCIFDKSYSKYNSTIKKILAYKNGSNWETDFWNEVSKEFDK